MRKVFKYIFMTLWILAVVALLGVFTYLFLQKQKENDISFTLSSYNKKVSLSDFEDKVVMIYFGYTHCPDICPTSLYLMSDVYKKLSKKEQKQVQPIFISVDPKRDTPKILDEYVKYFDKDVIGLTGNKEQIDKTTKKYHAFYSFVQTKNSSLKYTVSHTTRIYMVDKDGELKFSIGGYGQNETNLLRKIKSLL